MTETTKPTPAHASQYLEAQPYEIPQGESQTPLHVFPGDYVLSWGGGKRSVMTEPEYEAQYGKPDHSEYWERKREDALARAAQHAVEHGVHR